MGLVSFRSGRCLITDEEVTIVKTGATGATGVTGVTGATGATGASGVTGAGGMPTEPSALLHKRTEAGEVMAAGTNGNPCQCFQREKSVARLH